MGEQVCVVCAQRAARIKRLETDLEKAKDENTGLRDLVEELRKEVANLETSSPMGFTPPVLAKLKLVNPRTGRHCSVCAESQYETASGVCCMNGHGGVVSLEENPMAGLNSEAGAIKTDLEPPEELLALCRLGRRPKGWLLAVGKGPCVSCGQPTSALVQETRQWQHYECASAKYASITDKPALVDPNYGVLGHNRPAPPIGVLKLETIKADVVVKTETMHNVIVEKSRLDDSLDF